MDPPQRRRPTDTQSGQVQDVSNREVPLRRLASDDEISDRAPRRQSGVSVQEQLDLLRNVVYHMAQQQSHRRRNDGEVELIRSNRSEPRRTLRVATPRRPVSHTIPRVRRQAQRAEARFPQETHPNAEEESRNSQNTVQDNDHRSDGLRAAEDNYDNDEVEYFDASNSWETEKDDSSVNESEESDFRLVGISDTEEEDLFHRGEKEGISPPPSRRERPHLRPRTTRIPKPRTHRNNGYSSIENSDNNIHINVDTIAQTLAQHMPKPSGLSRTETTPPMFDGKKSNARRWLREYKTAAVHNGWDDVTTTRRVYFALDENTREWYYATFGEFCQSWDQFKINLYRRFGLDNETDALVFELVNTRQQPGELGCQYMDKILRICRKVDLNLNESRRVKYVQNGLLRRFKLAISGVRDIATARDILSTIDGEDVALAEQRHQRSQANAGYSRENPNPRNNSRNLILTQSESSVNSKYNFGPNNNCNDKNQCNTDYRQNRNQNNIRNSDNESLLNSNPQDRNQNNVNQRSQRNNRDIVNRRICFNCGNNGHIVNQCPQPLDRDKVRQNAQRARETRAGNNPDIQHSRDQQRSADRGQGNRFFNRLEDVPPYQSPNQQCQQNQQHSQQQLSTQQPLLQALSAQQPTISQPSIWAQFSSAMGIPTTTTTPSYNTDQRPLISSFHNFIAPNARIVTFTNSGDLSLMANVAFTSNGPVVTRIVDLGEVPVVHMRIEKWRVSSLIDTGSAITVITPYLAFLTRKTWYPWLNGPLRVADGRTATPMGVMEVEIEFMGKCILMPVAIIPGLSTDVIIGNDFNTPMNIVIMCGTKEIRFGENLNLGIESQKPPSNPNNYIIWKPTVSTEAIPIPTTPPPDLPNEPPMARFPELVVNQFSTISQSTCNAFQQPVISSFCSFGNIEPNAPPTYDTSATLITDVIFKPSEVKLLKAKINIENDGLHLLETNKVYKEKGFRIDYLFNN
jgi:hypothetical protein